MIPWTLATLALLGQVPALPPPEHPVLPQLYRPPYYGPALAEVTLGRSFKPGALGQVTLPVPSGYTGQIVFSFRVQCDPPSALRSWHWESLPDGLNSVIHVEIARPAFVSWTARVLTPAEAVTRIQKKQFELWLAGSSPQPGLKAAVARGAAEIGEAERDELAGAAAMWVARYRGAWPSAKGPKTAAVDGSDSLDRALLCAEILRTRKVPARAVYYAPVLLGAEARPMWLDEYESDDKTWQMIDPTIGVKEPMRNTALVLSIPSLAEEKGLLEAASTDPTRVSELPADPELSVRLVKVYPWQAASRLMPVAKIRGRRTMEAAKAGKDDWIDDAAFAQALAKGPINLALFLTGQPALPVGPKG